MEKQFNCPECGSDRTQKVKVLYETGTSSSRMTMMGIGVGGGGRVGVGVGTGVGSSQSELAKKLSPPAKPGSIAGWVVVIILALAIFSMAIICFSMEGGIGPGLTVMLIAAGFFTKAYLMIKKESNKRARYDGDYAEWERMWYCSRCGHTFYIE